MSLSERAAVLLVAIVWCVCMLLAWLFGVPPIGGSVPDAGASGGREVMNMRSRYALALLCAGCVAADPAGTNGLLPGSRAPVPVADAEPPDTGAALDAGSIAADLGVQSDQAPPAPDLVSALPDVAPPLDQAPPAPDLAPDVPPGVPLCAAPTNTARACKLGQYAPGQLRRSGLPCYLCDVAGCAAARFGAAVHLECPGPVYCVSSCTECQPTGAACEVRP